MRPWNFHHVFDMLNYLIANTALAAYLQEGSLTQGDGQVRAQKVRIMPMPRFAIILAIPLALAACESGNQKQTAGSVIGAVAGGLVGSTIGGGSGRTAAIIAGAAIGGLAGNQLGAALDERDRERAAYSTQAALESSPTGQSTSWRNPETGNYGSTTPTRTFTDINGQPCREYQTTVTVAGKRQQAYGTACRDADGSWRIVS